MVCDKVVCDRWCVIKLCVKDGVDKVVCERWLVCQSGVSARRASEAGEAAGYKMKNKNPTQRCGEKLMKAKTGREAMPSYLHHLRFAACQD